MPADLSGVTEAAEQRRAWTAEYTRALTEARNQGATLDKLAQAAGVSREAVRRFLQRNTTQEEER